MAVLSRQVGEVLGILIGVAVNTKDKTIEGYTFIFLFHRFIKEKAYIKIFKMYFRIEQVILGQYNECIKVRIQTLRIELSCVSHIYC